MVRFGEPDEWTSEYWKSNLRYIQKGTYLCVIKFRIREYFGEKRVLFLRPETVRAIGVLIKPHQIRETVCNDSVLTNRNDNGRGSL